MIITLPKLAEAMEVAKDEFIKHFKLTSSSPEPFAAGAFLMMSYILRSLGLKSPNEPIFDAITRMKQGGPIFDLINPGDRNFMALMLKQMFQPLGVVRVVIVGISAEGRAFITSMHDGDIGDSAIPEIKDVLQQIIESDDCEDLTL